MKILFLVPEPFFVIRGSSVTTRAWIRTLAEAGHKVDLICYPEGRAEDIGQASVRRTLSFAGSSALRDLCMFFMALSMCIRNRYDVIHALNQGAFSAVTLKRIFKSRFVYDLDLDPVEVFSEGTWLTRRFKAAVGRRLERSVLKRADVILVSSPTRAERARATGTPARVAEFDDPPYDLPMGENRDGSVQIRQEFGIGTAPVILYTGSFADPQQMDLLLRSARLVHDQKPDAFFLLAGEKTAEIPKLQKLAAMLDISDRCIFAGLKSLGQISALLATASVVVSPRLRPARTFSKLFTYMLSNRVIVATRMADQERMLDASCAILTRTEPDDLAAGIVRALDEPLISRALAREAWSRAAANHTMASFKHKVRGFYQQLLSGDPAPDDNGQLSSSSVSEKLGEKFSTK